jgi:hypothetical protein
MIYHLELSLASSVHPGIVSGMDLGSEGDIDAVFRIRIQLLMK